MSALTHRLDHVAEFAVGALRFAKCQIRRPDADRRLEIFERGDRLDVAKPDRVKHGPRRRPVRGNRIVHQRFGRLVREPTHHTPRTKPAIALRQNLRLLCNKDGTERVKEA